MTRHGKYGMQLRIESVDGSPINDYRIQGEQVEMRALGPSGLPLPGDASHWRALDDNEVAIHHALGTVVSRWLRVRLAGQRAASVRAA